MVLMLDCADVQNANVQIKKGKGDSFLELSLFYVDVKVLVNINI